MIELENQKKQLEEELREMRNTLDSLKASIQEERKKREEAERAQREAAERAQREEAERAKRAKPEKVSAEVHGREKEKAKPTDTSLLTQCSECITSSKGYANLKQRVKHCLPDGAMDCAEEQLCCQLPAHNRRKCIVCRKLDFSDCPLLQ